MKLTRIEIFITWLRSTIFLKWFTVFKMKHDESYLITYSLWEQLYLKKTSWIRCLDTDIDERIAIIDKGRDEKFEILLRRIYGEYACTITKRRIDGTCAEEYIKYIPCIDNCFYTPMMVYKLIDSQYWMQF